MAITGTTVSAAVGVNDNSITVASATGVAADNYVRVDQELMRVTKAYVSGSLTVPVLRGQDGTVTATHPASALAVTFLASDEPGPTATTVTQFPNVRGTVMASYSASGAIALPPPGSDLRVELNGTGALAMTIVVPTKDMNGTTVLIYGNGKAAHTITPAGQVGAGGAGYAKYTFAAGANNCIGLIASNALWLPFPSLTGGTATNITATISA